MPHILFLLGVFLCSSAVPALAGEVVAETPETLIMHRESEASFPAHEMEGFFSLGYRWSDLDDSSRAAEYHHPDSSVTAALDIAAYPLPHRFNLSTEYLCQRDYAGDLGYAYSDLLLFRDIFVGVYHNLDHYNYQYAGAASDPSWLDKNSSDNYYVGVFEEFVSLRLKASDFPFHVFLKHRYLANEGNVQQRFMIGQHGDITKVSESREVDWQSNALTLGANSHFGPAEMEYSLEVNKFDPGGNSILYDWHPTSPTTGYQYPHDVNPETESSEHSLKMHTSYTGALVAAATLGELNQKNNFSGTKSETWRGGADLSWIPDPDLNFFAKFRHQEVEIDNPDYVRRFVGDADNIVRQSISAKNDLFSLAARYRPLQKITILADYEFVHHERENIAEWRLLPESTKSNTLKLSASFRPVNTLKIKVGTDYRFVNDPGSNIEPDYSNKTQFTTTYLPTTWLTAFLDYRRAKTVRDNTAFLNSEPDITVNSGRRETKNDKFFSSLSFLFSPESILTASFAHFRGEVEQNLAYGKWNSAGTGDMPYLDQEVIYVDRADSYALSLNFSPWGWMDVLTSVSYTESDGEFQAGISTAQTPVPLDSFSTLQVAETVYAVEISKTFPSKFVVGLRFLSILFDDKNDDTQDSRIYISTCTLKRHF